MAEVGQRLGSGVYRLSALRNSQSRPVCSGESPESVLVLCAFTDSRNKDERELVQRGVLPQSRTNGTRRRSDEPHRVRRNQQVNGAFLCTTCFDPDSSRFIRFVHTRESLQACYRTSLNPSSAGLRDRLLLPLLPPGRRTAWSRGASSIHRDAFRSPQQLRAFCAVIFVPTQPSSGPRRPPLDAAPPRPPQTRGYSWRSDGSTKDGPPYRSRTAYYDILKVSPGATQSQIKTAYYKQSFIYHPDKNPGSKDATLRFSEISEAYTVLGNISLRRKYDRGILSQSDVQSAGRPSSNEAPGKSTGSPQQRQQRARRFSQATGKTMFDFDAFYQAHYGEQLRRERDLRARMQQMEEMRKQRLHTWRRTKMMEVTVMMMLTAAGLILFNISRS